VNRQSIPFTLSFIFGYSDPAEFCGDLSMQEILKRIDHPTRKSHNLEGPGNAFWLFTNPTASFAFFASLIASHQKRKQSAWAIKQKRSNKITLV